MLIAISAPIVVVLIALASNSIAFVPVVVFCLLISVSTTMGFVRFISLSMSVSTITVPLTMAVAFLATSWMALTVVLYYNHYLARGLTTKKATINTIKSSLPPCVLWWISFMAPCIGIFVFSANKLSVANALCVAVAFTVAFLVTMTVIPAMTGLFKTFFSVSGILPCFGFCRSRHVMGEYEEVNKIRSSFL